MSKPATKRSAKTKTPKTKLGLPDLDHSKAAILGSGSALPLRIGGSPQDACPSRRAGDDTSQDAPARDCALRHPLEIHVGVHRLVSRQHEGPVFIVMVGVDDSEHSVANVSNLIAAGRTDKIEFHGPSV